MSISSHKGEGSCPALLYYLFPELDGAIEIPIAAYLFNNPIYTSFLIHLAEMGTKVYITSPPINGYSLKKTRVEGKKEKVSGREAAVEAYSRISKTENIQLKNEI